MTAPWGFKFFNKVDMSQHVKDLLSSWFLRDHFVAQEMCNEAVEKSPWVLKFLPDQYKTQEMCNGAVQNEPWMLEHVPDQFKTQEMCNRAVGQRP